MISLARTVAFDVLLEWERHGGHADELLRARLDPLSAPDRRLATEVAMGVLRWRSSLDDLLRPHSSKPLEKLDIEVLTALRMAVYQVLWLDRVPAPAAVNDSVALVKRARKTSAAPFANAVLRRVAAEAGTRRRDVREPRPGNDSPPVLARACAHPAWLVARWSREFGAEAARTICAFDQQPPRPVLRLADPALAEDLAKEGIELAPGSLLARARRIVRGDVTRTAAFRQGRAHIQDEASQLVALLVGQGERILDCCAAPGGKTAALAERNPGARIVAAEVDPARAEAMRARLVGSAVEILAADARRLPPGHFDRVLADVPCSGTGTLARNPEIKWRLRPEDLAKYAAKQRAILVSALDHLQPGGRLIYATCSLEREEGEEVIEAVLAAHPELELVAMADLLEELRAGGDLIDPELGSLLRGPYLRTLPGIHPCDGFFAAAIVRR